MSKVLRVSVVAVGLAAVAALGFMARHAIEGALLWQVNPPAADQAIGLNGQKFQRWSKPRDVPNLRFSDPAGKPTSLAEFRGRVVLLNLWATWCPPCREEMPALDRLNARMGGDKFVVVTLVLDSPAKVEVFLRQIKATTLRGYTDTQGLSMSTLGATALPTTILIDARGREIGRLSGVAAWDEKPALDLIQSYLKETS
jgi:thiol-disulfide isomerase/thioredoxin